MVIIQIYGFGSIIKTMRYRLTIGKDRHLGTLLIYKDFADRKSLKLSFPHKFIGVDFLGEQKRDAESYNMGNADALKWTPKGSTLELSYKFNNKKLEVKNEIKKGSIERRFFDIAIPAMSPLFLIRLKDISILPMVAPEKADAQNMDISGGLQCKNFLIEFSFEGADGEPWTDILFKGKTVAKTRMALPEEPRVLHILVACDDKPPEGDDGLSIWFPEEHTPTKMTA